MNIATVIGIVFGIAILSFATYLSTDSAGVFAKLVKPDTVLRDRDRVEIYRPLIADPKEVRKQRAAEGKAMKKGAGDTDAS